MKTLRVLLVGDVVGPSGIALFQKHSAQIKQKHAIDFIIVNGENSASNGRGLTAKGVTTLHEAGANVVTTGNHVWDQKDIYSYINEHHNLLRPANFPPGVPGVGATVVMCQNQKIAVINIQGRVFMREQIDCPFRAMDEILQYIRPQTPHIFVDFHAEITAEKMAMGHYLDGKVSAVVGTHTHVATADERILPLGTAFVTDLGMTGALNGMLGMKKEPIISRMINQMPTRFEVETVGPWVLSGVYVEIEVGTGKALAISRVRIVDSEFVYLG